jgi:hypothetical protein
MQLADALSLNTPTSWVLWFVVLTLAMYFARFPAQRVILTLTHAIYRALRMASRSVLRAAEKLVLRNREVLLAAGREAAERIVEREFERIDASARRDLSECPTLNRRLSEQATRLEEDHDRSKVVPPTPPGWVDAVNAVANIDSRGDPMVAKILDSIQSSLIKAQDHARDDYRTATEARHEHLKAMIPAWRKAIQLLGQVDGKVTSLLQRTQIIDRHMDEYENILKKTERAERMLSSSSLVQFFISFFVLGIAVGGALINFNLIARPMAEMVGGGNYIGGFKIADIAALVIILVELSMGLFLMESLRITRLFPVIGALSDVMRIRMIWITLTILASLACVEAGLAYMREILLQDELATSALLRGGDGAGYQIQFQWITTAAQMGMGFLLPFALTFVAIPLETFVHSLRTVLGITTVGFLRGFAVLLRFFGDAFRYLGKALVDIYDVVIFLPLWLELQVKSHSGGLRKPVREQS